MYDRVKSRRKSTDPDIYSEENDDNEQAEEQNDQNNENDNDTNKSKNKKKEQTRQNGSDDMIEENTMDILSQDEEEEEEELNNQQTAKYSLRERKPPIQRFSLYGNFNFSQSILKLIHIYILLKKGKQWYIVNLFPRRCSISE
jgi:hypothetical protein